jgi:antitoxin VapB
MNFTAASTNPWHLVVSDGIDHAMSARAKVFMNGRSQAIRLPKDFRVSGDTVTLKRVPDGILISERDPWDACEEACQGIPESFFKAMESRNQNLKLEKRAWRDDV